MLMAIVWVLVFVVFVLGVVVVVGGRGGGGGGGGGDGGDGGLKCIIIFNFHGLRCSHKAKIYRISKIKYLI
jgi:hypothetical protein